MSVCYRTIVSPYLMNGNCRLDKTVVLYGSTHNCNNHQIFLVNCAWFVKKFLPNVSLLLVELPSTNTWKKHREYRDVSPSMFVKFYSKVNGKYSKDLATS